MHLVFESIKITRFRSFLETAVLSFSRAGPGLYFLKGKNKTNSALGSNGSGKSSVIDALMWCLYGKTVQGLKNPDIIPWTGKGQTIVEVTISIDKTNHVVRRSANPNSLTLDDKEAGQEYINKLIAIPFEIIPYTIILGQRQPLFFDLTASEKLKLFSECLNLDRWEARSQHASELSQNLDKEISIKQSELEASLNALAQADSDFKALKQQSSQWEENRALQLATAEKNKKLLQGEITAVTNIKDNADLKYDRAMTELKAFKPLLDKLHAEERPLSSIVDRLARDKREHTDKKIELQKTLQSLDSKICPTCSQPLQSPKIIKQLTDQLNGYIHVQEDLIATTEKTLNEAIKKHHKILKSIEIQEKAKEQFEHDAEEARDVLDRLLPKIANWEAEIKALDRQCATSAEADNPYTEQIQTLRRRRDSSKVAIETCQKTITSRSEYLERARFWIKGFKDVRLLIVEEILQELEIVTGAMLEEFGLVNWQIKYDIERENKSGNVTRGLNIVVLSPNNKNPVKWESWSGGEAQRLRIIGTAALSSVLLNHVGVTTNLEIYDEPTESLSREGVSDLVELLAQRAKDAKKSIFFVDHHVIESSNFIQTILVTKDKNGSYLSQL
jgi:DNA repair exonuclease SbcCD ATPase subunit